MTERFIVDVDEAIIDTKNENVEYAYWEAKGVEDICDLLNELNDRNTQLQEEIKDFQDLLASKEEIYLKPIIRTIKEAYESERTQIGRNVLKQLLEQME